MKIELLVVLEPEDYGEFVDILNISGKDAAIRVMNQEFDKAIRNIDLSDAMANVRVATEWPDGLEFLEVRV